MLTRDLEQARIPDIMVRFEQMVSEHVWLEQAAKIATEMESRPELAEYLLSENRVVFSLAECTIAARNNNGRLPFEMTHQPQHLEAFVFAWRVVQLAEAARQLTNKRYSIFIKRVREALRSPQMIKAMQMEATIATHFVAAGCRVLFPEIGAGSETFDLLIEDLGPRGLEIECKVVTANKGRKIHVAESRELLTLLVSQSCIQLAAARGTEGLAIRVTVPKRLPDREHWNQLCREVAQVVLSGRSSRLPDGTLVSLFDFHPSVLGKLEMPPSSLMRKSIEEITGAVNRHVLFFRPRENAGGIVALVLDSEQPDSMLHELFQTFEDSAGRQLTGNRAGALFATFEGIEANQLSELSSEVTRTGQHSALAWRASAFLEKTRFPYVVGVGFLSEADYSSPQAASGGTAFWIPKPISAHWHPSFSGIFGPDSRAHHLLV